MRTQPRVSALLLLPFLTATLLLLLSSSSSPTNALPVPDDDDQFVQGFPPMGIQSANMLDTIPTLTHEVSHTTEHSTSLDGGAAGTSQIQINTPLQTLDSLPVVNVMYEEPFTPTQEVSTQTSFGITRPDGPPGTVYPLPGATTTQYQSSMENMVTSFVEEEEAKSGETETVVAEEVKQKEEEETDANSDAGWSFFF